MRTDKVLSNSIPEEADHMMAFPPKNYFTSTTLAILVMSIWFSSQWIEASPLVQPYRYQQPDGRYFVYQNEDGQFQVGNWTVNGVARGTFGWKDPSGIETIIEYIADEDGYRILRKRNFTIPRFGSRNHEGIEEDPSDPDHAVVEYRYGYLTDSSYRVEEKRKSGIVYGKFGYIDANGKLRMTFYVSKANRGFLAIHQVLDPNRGHRVSLSEAYKLPLRDVASELGLKHYYRAKEPDLQQLV